MVIPEATSTASAVQSPNLVIDLFVTRGRSESRESPALLQHIYDTRRILNTGYRQSHTCAEMSNLARTLRPLLRCVRSQRRTYADAAGNQMKFTFAGANQVFYDQAAIRQVDVPSFSGSFGILPKHVPTLAVLKPGVVTIYEEDGSTKKVFVSSGTVTINEDSSVQILAEEAHPVENLDNSAAKDILNKAQQQLSSASSDVDKAEASIAVEVAEALVQATQ